MSKPDPITDEEFCRRNGWDVGTTLQFVGKNIHIQITAFQDGKVWAKTVYWRGEEITHTNPCIWGMQGRRWVIRKYCEA